MAVRVGGWLDRDGPPLGSLETWLADLILHYLSMYDQKESTNDVACKVSRGLSHSVNVGSEPNP